MSNTNYISLMRKTIYILLFALCAGLSSCRSQKEAVTASAEVNPYLVHYLPGTAADSIKNIPRTQTKVNGGEYNLEKVQESVNPEKTSVWGDILLDILQNIFYKGH